MSQLILLPCLDSDNRPAGSLEAVKIPKVGNDRNKPKGA